MKIVTAMTLGSIVLVTITVIGSYNAWAGYFCAPELVYNPNLVRRVQEKLREIDSTLSVDGKWGPNSQKALHEFQRKRHLVTTEELDESTFAELFGQKAPYQPISTLVENPHHMPEDIYRRECLGERPR